MRHIPKIRGAHGRHQSDSGKDCASKWKASHSFSGRAIAYRNLFRQLILPSRLTSRDVRRMRESGVPAHGVSAVDPATRATSSGRGHSLGVGPTSGSAGLFIRSGYVQKRASTRCCGGVKISETFSRNQNHHESAHTDSVVSLFRAHFTYRSQTESWSLYPHLFIEISNIELDFSTQLV